MRIVIVGLGSQGINRQISAKYECIATVDRTHLGATHQTLQELSINSYDAVLVCTADEQKYSLMRYALANKKHVLVEQPLVVKPQQIEELEHLAKANKLVCYMASSYRFEPYIVRVKQLLDAKILGEIYHCRISWSDNSVKHVLYELGTNLLDILYYWFGSKIKNKNFSIISKKAYKQETPNHVIFGDLTSSSTVEIEISSLALRKHFSCDIIAANGTVHIDSLCKWGTSSFLHLQLDATDQSTIEDNQTIVQLNPILDLEYAHFKELCAKFNADHDLSKDQWVYAEIARLNNEEVLIA